MIGIVKSHGILVKKNGLRFFERNAVLSQVLFAFGFVPFEGKIIHMYSVCNSYGEVKVRDEKSALLPFPDQKLRKIGNIFKLPQLMSQLAPDTLIAAAAILEDGSVLSPAVIHIAAGKIADVSSEIPQIKNSRTLDLGSTMLFPGFVNAHAHLDLTAVGSLERAPFAKWVTELVGKKRKLSDSEIATGIKMGAQALLRSGVTTVLDHVSSGTPLQAFEDLPLSVVAFGEVGGRSEAKASASYTDFMLAKKHAPIPLHITPHALYSVALDVLQDVLEDEPGPFSIHLNESLDEKLYFESRQGGLAELIDSLTDTDLPFHDSAIQALYELAPNLENALLVHCNYLSAEDIATLTAWHDATVVHCPGSFAFFGHAEFPWRKLAGAGVKVALGTDSLASNTELNFLDEIRLFLKMFPATKFEELLPMITTNAAHALGLKHVGKIAVGCVADLIGFKMDGKTAPLDVLTRSQKVNFVLTRGVPREV